MTTRRIGIGLLFGFAAILAVLLYGRSSRMSPESATAPLPVVNVATAIGYLGSGLIYVAQAKGYFQDAGIRVVIEPHKSGKAALDAVLDGKFDIATSADPPLMFAMMRGRPVSVFATICTQSRDDVLVGRKDRGIHEPADLKGKRIGVPLGTSSHYLLDAMLLAHLVSLQEVELIDLKPPDMLEGLRSGKVDAIAVWDPYLAAIREALGENASSFDAAGLYSVTFNLAASSGYIRQNRGTIDAMLRALVRAEEFAARNPAEARAIIAEGVGVEPNTVARIWPDYQLQVKLDQNLLTVLENEARWAIRHGYVERTDVPNLLPFIYPDALHAVKPHAMTIVR